MTAQAPQPEPQSKDAVFLDAVRSKSAELNSVPDYMLVDLAGNICDALQAGVPIEQVLTIGVNSGLSSTSVAAIAAGAVVFYCPEQNDLTASS